MYKPNSGSSSGSNLLAFPQRPNTPAPTDLACPGDATPELRFALTRMQERDYGELALGGETESGDLDTTFYQWMEDKQGARWQIQPHAYLEGDAQNWMRTFAPDQVSGGRPKSCVNTLQQLMTYERRFLPQSSDLNLVPLRNAYLVIEDDGTIRCVAPDRKYGVDYTIQVDLDMTRVDPETGIYTPAISTKDGYWNRYITSTLADQEVRDYAQECLSTVLLSRCYEKGIWLYGEGENGKSVMLHLLRQLAPRHTAAIKLSRLVRDQFGTGQLNSKRIVLVSEMPSRLEREMQTVLKGLISRDPTPCEKKGRDEFTFTPKAVWVFATNHHPDMSEHEHGFWRKVETLPFTNRVDPSAKVLDLHKLIAESPGEMQQFIDWLLIGASRLSKNKRWRTHEEKPAAIRQLAFAQRKETDTVVGWLNECDLKFDAGALTSKKRIYDAYREYVSDCGKYPVADTKFWARLKENFRDFGFDTEGEQRTIDRKRQRCVNLVLDGVSPDFQASRVKRALDSGEAFQVQEDIFKRGHGGEPQL